MIPQHILSAGSCTNEFKTESKFRKNLRGPDSRHHLTFDNETLIDGKNFFTKDA